MTHPSTATPATLPQRNLSLSDVARHYNVHRDSITKLIALGMPATRMGPRGQYRMNLEEVQAWLDNGPAEDAPAESPTAAEALAKFRRGTA